MTKLIGLLALAFALPAYAASPVKTCATTLSLPGSDTKIETLVEVFEENGTLRAVVTQGADGNKASYPETAELGEYSVRGNVDKAELDTLNRGESLVAHAMIYLKEFSGTDLDVDLEDVRRVKVYQIGQATNLGSSAIVESYDAKGKLLGSFFGGLLVSDCR